jgi:hypothetical protein
MVNDTEVTQVPEDVRDAIKAKEAFAGFLKTEAWLYLAAWIEDQVRQRGDQVVLKPLENILEVTQQEFTKGEMAFGRTILTFPETLLTTAQETIDDYNAKKEQDDGEAEDETEGLDAPDGDTSGGTAYSGDADPD